MRTWDPRAQMARPLGKKGHHKGSFLRASVKMGHELYLESKLESIVALALDVDPGVRAFFAQPFCINLLTQDVYPSKRAAVASLRLQGLRSELRDEESELLYTPDLLVEFCCPPKLLIEVKGAAQLDRFQAQMKTRIAAAQSAGYRMIVVTDEHVGHKGLEANLVAIRDATYALRKQGSSTQMQQLQDAAEYIGGRFELQQLRSRFTDGVLLMGIASGVLGCDVRAGKFARNSQGWPAHGDLSHLQVLNLSAAPARTPPAISPRDALRSNARLTSPAPQAETPNHHVSNHRTLQSSSMERQPLGCPELQTQARKAPTHLR
ncbi:hypothetical protein QTH91_20070 [Variovorax dokdonensis]|uniref:TnsA endonuclease N-terminal domain-containing protein n=1 Tax=Variovorax dokdonensis TaxID=344883 RepID=A0ABT7NFS5_9BURK|nr:hypothetical protein [Variovorax dokdonensis]MDM0046799.1 hypothetical protein [Variovorax dokdonensis]